MWARLLDMWGYNTGSGATQGSQICRSSGYWAIEWVLVGDRLFDAQGRSYAFVEHTGGKLVVTADTDRPTRFKPERLCFYLVLVNRTKRGLAKERLRDFWEG